MRQDGPASTITTTPSYTTRWGAIVAPAGGLRFSAATAPLFAVLQRRKWNRTRLSTTTLVAMAENKIFQPVADGGDWRRNAVIGR